MAGWADPAPVARSPARGVMTAMFRDPAAALGETAELPQPAKGTVAWIARLARATPPATPAATGRLPVLSLFARNGSVAGMIASSQHRMPRSTRQRVRCCPVRAGSAEP